MKNFYLLFLLCSLSMMTAKAQVTTTQVITGMQAAYGLAVVGDQMYVSDQDGNKIYRFEYQAVNPTLTEIASIANPTDFALVGDDLYFSTGSFDNGVGIYRFDATAATPTLETVYATTNRTNGITIIGDELYYVTRTGGSLRKFNLTEMNPTPTTIVSGLSVPQGMSLHNNLLYVAETGADRVSSVDPTASNPTSMFVASVTSTPLGMTTNGNFLYVAGVFGGLTRVDLNQTPAVATPISEVTLPDMLGSLYVDGVLYVTSGGSVYKVEGLASSFTLPTVCNDEDTAILGGASPTGGVYSGPGVTDNGNGNDFTFDVAGQGVGSFNVTYSINGTMASTTLQVVAAPTVTFSTGGLSVQVDAGVQTGLSGGMPAGGVYSGNGVTDNGNGMTYSFDPATAGEGENVITYTYADANGCGGAQGAVITVTPAIVPGDLCAEAIDISTLFGGALDAPQTSGLYDNTNFTAGADDPAAGFDCFYGGDALQNTGWFSFTGDGNTYQVRNVQCTGPNANLDLQAVVYSGSCGNLTTVACNEDEDGLNSIFNFSVEFDTEAGVEYLILVDGFDGTAGEFCIEVTNLTDPLLPGEMCTNAIDISALTGQAQMVPQASETYDNYVGYDTDMTDLIPSCLNSLMPGTGTIWFSFTGDGNRYTINSANSSNPTNALIGVIYSGNCDMLTELACDYTFEDASFSIDLQTESGVEYLIMVAEDFFDQTASFNLEVTNQGSVGVTDLSNTEFKIYPNPTQGMIQLPQIDLERVEAYDATGRLVVSEQQPSTSIDLSAQPAGLYILKMYAGKEVYSAKVVKE